MKTSQSFIYDKSGNIEFITKEDFIKQFSNLYKEQLVDSLSYSAIIKKYEKNFTQLSKGIYKVNKLQKDKAIICIINKTIEDFEKVYKKEQKLTIPSKYDIIKNYQPKETKEKLKMKNKKLIKRIAVASLACFLAIPTINTVPTQAKTVATVEYYENKIKEKEDKIERIKKSHDSESEKQQAIEGQLRQIEKYKESIKDIQNGSIIYVFEDKADLQNYQQQQAVEKAQRQAEQSAQKAAEQAEKDRIANTIYQIPAGVDNVYDFVPHVDKLDKLHTYDDDEVHKYERADMPGIVFTLRCSWNPSINRYSIIDVKPHYSFSNFKSIRIKRYDKYGSSRIVNCYIKQFTYNYLSPFDAFGSLTSEYMQASIGEDPRLATYTGGIAGIKKGENSFAAHLFWKETDENGVATFDGNNGQLKGIGTAKTAEEFQNIINKYASRQCQPLTDRKSDELSGSIKKGQQLVEQWDAAGMDVIIEVTEE